MINKWVWLKTMHARFAHIASTPLPEILATPLIIYVDIYMYTYMYMYVYM